MKNGKQLKKVQLAYLNYCNKTVGTPSRPSSLRERGLAPPHPSDKDVRLEIDI